MNKRCGNCAKYPFCNKTNGATEYCDDWIKRKIQKQTRITIKGSEENGDN